jgi:hypothetical protein
MEVINMEHDIYILLQGLHEKIDFLIKKLEEAEKKVKEAK